MCDNESRSTLFPNFEFLETLKIIEYRVSYKLSHFEFCEFYVQIHLGINKLKFIVKRNLQLVSKENKYKTLNKRLQNLTFRFQILIRFTVKKNLLEKYSTGTRSFYA